MPIKSFVSAAHDTADDEIGCGLLRVSTPLGTPKKGAAVPKAVRYRPRPYPALAANVFLVDVEREAGLRFRFHLIGTYVEFATQQWITPLHVEQLKVDDERENIPP